MRTFLAHAERFGRDFATKPHRSTQTVILGPRLQRSTPRVSGIVHAGQTNPTRLGTILLEGLLRLQLFR